MQCSMADCYNGVHCRGWCRKHYLFWWKYGDVNHVSRYHGLKEKDIHLYWVWVQMRQRCSNKNFHQYKDYGGRGIFVSEEWHYYPNFYYWSIENGYKRGLTVERIDNDDGYYPENCCYKTHLENNLNRRLLSSRNTSGYCGVSFWKGNKKWKSCIRIKGKDYYLGYFNSPKLAALRYDVEAYMLNDGRPRNFL